ncbi:hypothetical protein PAECIP111893_01916 [Paenibacillus plantiphilus]|uniref:Uncharacterized protein n=1 Tax=Paenibacillus plantiphilus TaxID=2905650 RepID=A0ABM9C4B9_9BACL|nr:hypothetical protein [Paenibacillus plantiphilus]CAH1202752.1 hypothetical protein PAECIP111893_01916 [Paenibacillus plantiphilus]
MTKRPFYFLARIVLIMIITLAALPLKEASAGFFDRISDIYNAPERVEELTDSFRKEQERMTQELSDQKDRLLEAQQSAEQYARQQEELMKQNEQYQQQNEQLINQNNTLLQRMEAMEAEKSERSQLYRKIIMSVLVIVGLGLLYLLSIRIWRYNVWRKHKRSGGGAKPWM